MLSTRSHPGEVKKLFQGAWRRIKLFLHHGEFLLYDPIPCHLNAIPRLPLCLKMSEELGLEIFLRAPLHWGGQAMESAQ